MKIWKRNILRTILRNQSRFKYYSNFSFRLCRNSLLIIFSEKSYIFLYTEVLYNYTQMNDVLHIEFNLFILWKMFCYCIIMRIMTILTNRGIINNCNLYNPESVVIFILSAEPFANQNKKGTVFQNFSYFHNIRWMIEVLRRWFVFSPVSIAICYCSLRNFVDQLNLVFTFN